MSRVYNTKRLKLFHGDAIEELKEIPDNRIDAIVTDPPYFLVNSSGSGFMGKEWDSISPANVLAAAYFKSMKLVYNTDEGSIAVESANTAFKEVESRSRRHNVGPAAKGSLTATQSSVFVPVIVLTRDEALVLCKELLPDLTSVVDALPKNAYFVGNPSWEEVLKPSIALRIAAVLYDDPAWLASAITFTKTDSDTLGNQVTEGQSGARSARKYTGGMNGAAGDAESIAREGTSNVTISFPGASHEIIRKITSLRCVSDAIKRFTKTPAAMGIISEWWHSRWASECYRVLKPGAHVLAFSGTRTSHYLASALESAGFELRDTIFWCYGSGFPKNMDIAKAIDKTAGVEFEAEPASGVGFMNAEGENGYNVTKNKLTRIGKSTPEAEEWQGWGTALKPAHEPIILARKPCSEKTVAANVLKWGTGAINIDGSRIGTDGGGTHCGNRDENGKCIGHNNAGISTSGETFHGPDTSGGRWPANVLFSHSDDCVLVSTSKVGSGKACKGEGKRPGGFMNVGADKGSGGRCGPYYGTEEVEVYDCAPDCPVAELDRQSGVSKSTGGRIGKKDASSVNIVPSGQYHKGDPGFGDVGGASRFFYVAKPSRSEKEAGLADRDSRNVNDGRKTSIDNAYQRGDTQRKNTHPTVKPVKLMEYLCNLITPPGGIVLDPFMGSGTTGIAALNKGFRFVGIEREEEYLEIAQARLLHALDEVAEAA